MSLAVLVIGLLARSDFATDELIFGAAFTLLFVVFGATMDCIPTEDIP